MRKTAATAVLLLASAFVACDDVTDIIPGETYELVEANGESLPAVVFDGELDPFGHVVATAVAGSITLRESTYTERFTIDITTNGQDFPGDPVTVRGDYTADGNLLTFEPEDDAPVFTGTLSGGTLTTVENHPDFGTLTLVWQR